VFFAAAFKDVNEQELQEEEQKIKDEPKRVNVQEPEVCLFRIVSSLRFVVVDKFCIQGRNVCLIRPAGLCSERTLQWRLGNLAPVSGSWSFECLTIKYGEIDGVLQRSIERVSCRFAGSEWRNQHKW
jgi:hypothetical protein